jgi:hypothetical protein
MAEREPVEVTVEIDGRELVAGTLWVHERGGQTASFRYFRLIPDQSRRLRTRPGAAQGGWRVPYAAGFGHVQRFRRQRT